MIPAGPIESEPVDSYRGRWFPEVQAELDVALAGIDLGAYDARIVEWLKNWDQPTIVTIASLIVRARAAGPVA